MPSKRLRMKKTKGESPVPVDITREEQAINGIEGAYCKKEPPRNRVTLLDELDIEWHWDESQIRHLREMWKQGLHVEDIARQLNIDQTSVELCIWWQAELGKIQAREGGAYGHR